MILEILILLYISIGSFVFGRLIEFTVSNLGFTPKKEIGSSLVLSIFWPLTMVWYFVSRD